MKEKIRHLAMELGFSACGFAEARPLSHLDDFYKTFIKEEKYAGMDYLRRYASPRINPAELLPGIKSVVAVLINYYPPFLIPSEDNFILSKYAPLKRYPPFIKRKMEPLKELINSLDSGILSKIYVDSGPVMEKVWAQLCGIGWQGKHTILIHPRGGSYFFIGIIFTTLKLEPDQAETDHCGNCTRCMDACPTAAISTPYQLDIRKCITYGTAVKNAVLTEEIRNNLKDRICGCDICQDACPFNSFSKPTKETHFHPPEALMEMRKKDWINLSRDQFNLLFAGTSVGEKGYERLMRNIQSAQK